MVFDKTGTLTEDGLEVNGYQPVRIYEDQPKFTDFQEEIKAIYPETAWWKTDFEKHKGSLETLFVESLANCHSITRVHGRLIGDPLDVKMFEHTEWHFEEIHDQPNVDELILAYVKPPIEGDQTDCMSPRMASFDSNDIVRVARKEGVEPQKYHYSLLRRFDFSSKLQRMSVISRLSHD